VVLLGGTGKILHRCVSFASVDTVLEFTWVKCMVLLGEKHAAEIHAADWSAKDTSTMEKVEHSEI